MLPTGGSTTGVADRPMCVQAGGVHDAGCGGTGGCVTDPEHAAAAATIHSEVNARTCKRFTMAESLVARSLNPFCDSGALRVDVDRQASVVLRAGDRKDQLAEHGA